MSDDRCALRQANAARAKLMDGDNAVHCDKCATKTATSFSTAMSVLPPTLMLQLQRFVQDDYGQFKKSNHRVAFPQQLDMWPCTREGVEARLASASAEQPAAAAAAAAAGPRSLWYNLVGARVPKTQNARRGGEGGASVLKALGTFVSLRKMHHSSALSVFQDPGRGAHRALSFPVLSASFTATREDQPQRPYGAILLFCYTHAQGIHACPERRMDAHAGLYILGRSGSAKAGFFLFV